MCPDVTDPFDPNQQRRAFEFVSAEFPHFADDAAESFRLSGVRRTFEVVRESTACPSTRRAMNAALLHVLATEPRVYDVVVLVA